MSITESLRGGRRAFLASSAAFAATIALQRPALAIAPDALPKLPPAATRTLTVGSGSGYAYRTVSDALRAARAGDHIMLADGQYTTPLEIASGAWGNGTVVIRSRSPRRAVFTKPITVRLPGVWLHEIKTTYRSAIDESQGGDFAVRVQADRFRMTRCQITARNGVNIVDAPRSLKDIQICYNTFDGENPGGVNTSHIFIGPVADKSKGPENLEIAWNKFVDNSAPSSSTSLVRRYYIHLGNSKPGDNDTGVNLTIRIHRNVFQGKRNKAIYLKRHCYVGFNHVKTVPGTVVFRHGGARSGAYGSGGVMEGNWIEGPDVVVSDTGAVLNGNKIVGGCIELHAGASLAGQGDELLYQAADNTTIVDTQLSAGKVIELGRIDTGKELDNSQGGLVTGLRIYKGRYANAPTVRVLTPGCTYEAPKTGFGPHARVEAVTLAYLTGKAGAF